MSNYTTRLRLKQTKSYDYPRSPTHNNVITNYSEFLIEGNFATFYNDRDWEVKVSKGQPAGHPYTRRLVESEGLGRASALESFSSPYGTAYCEASIDIPPYGLNDSENIVLNDVAYSVALEGIKKKLRDAQHNVNMLVPLAELREMRGLIKSVAQAGSTVVGAMIDLKRGRIRNAHRKASDLWLAYGFGIAPMISDTQNIAESIGLALNRTGSTVLRATKSARTQWSSVGAESALASGAFGYGASYYYRPLKNYSHKCAITVLYRENIVGQNDYSMLKQLGFSLPNLPSVGWELIPGSWIVDYFSNFGQFLEDTFIGASVNVVDVIRSDKVNLRVRNKIRSKYTSTGGSQLLQFSSSPSYGERVLFKRTVLGSLPRTPLRFKTSDELAMNAYRKFLNLTSVLSVLRSK